MENKIQYTPIGFYESEQKNPYEAGRQPDEHHSPGCIHLQSGNNFEQALIGLEGFSHIWVLFQFHHNDNWKPMVSPPRGTDSKIGVFATRAPYRPNNIGMSVVRLEKIEGLKLYVTEADILDGSPILDIKPYLSYVDAKTEATQGWIRPEEKFQIQITELAQEKINWLQPHIPQLTSFIQHQLEFEPTNKKKKRVQQSGEHWTIAYRTWRVHFTLHEMKISITDVSSGYTAADLSAMEDRYQDKALHREFNQYFEQR